MICPICGSLEWNKLRGTTPSVNDSSGFLQALYCGWAKAQQYVSYICLPQISGPEDSVRHLVQFCHSCIWVRFGCWVRLCDVLRFNLSWSGFSVLSSRFLAIDTHAAHCRMENKQKNNKYIWNAGCLLRIFCHSFNCIQYVVFLFTFSVTPITTLIMHVVSLKYSVSDFVKLSHSRWHYIRNAYCVLSLLYLHSESMLCLLQKRFVLQAGSCRRRRCLFPRLLQVFAQHPPPPLVRLLLGRFARLRTCLLGTDDRRL